MNKLKYLPRKKAQELYKQFGEVRPEMVERVLDDALNKIAQQISLGELTFEFQMANYNNITVFSPPRTFKERWIARFRCLFDDYDLTEGVILNVNLGEIREVRHRLVELGYDEIEYGTNVYRTKVVFTVVWK